MIQHIQALKIGRDSIMLESWTDWVEFNGDRVSQPHKDPSLTKGEHFLNNLSSNLISSTTKEPSNNSSVFLVHVSNILFPLNYV